jgi:hypothetical protein
MSGKKRLGKKPAKARNPIARALRAVGLFGQKVVTDKRRKPPARKRPRWRQGDGE